MLTPWPIRFTLVVSKVYDGDTIEGDIVADAGLGIAVTLRDWKLRLWGINAPELHDAGGVASRDFLQALVLARTTLKFDSYAFDEFKKRIDGVPFLEDGTDLCQAMLAAGQAVPYRP